MTRTTTQVEKLPLDSKVVVEVECVSAASAVVVVVVAVAAATWLEEQEEEDRVGMPTSSS